MKIVSKHKDFYDYYAKNALISDQSFTWNRSIEKVKTNFAHPVIFTDTTYSFSSRFRNEASLAGFNIFFCGRIIPVMYVENKTWDKSIRDYFYDIDSLPDSVKVYKKSQPWVWKKIVDFFSVTNQTWNYKQANGLVLVKKDLIDMHRFLKTPVFINTCLLNDGRYVDDHGITSDELFQRIYVGSTIRNSSPVFTTNIILSKFDFIKKMDAFTCFQELERFLSNDLSTYQDKSDQVKISDKLKAETHGFDKFSFRKDKSTR